MNTYDRSAQIWPQPPPAVRDSHTADPAGGSPSAPVFSESGQPGMPGTPEAIEAGIVERRRSNADTTDTLDTPERDGQAPVAVEQEENELAQRRARGVEWVRPTDLIARGGGHLSRTGIDFEEGLVRRARAGLGVEAKRFGERAQKLAPISAFGRGAGQDHPHRSPVGMA